MKVVHFTNESSLTIMRLIYNRSCIMISKAPLFKVSAWVRSGANSRLCVQRVIWTPRTLFFDSLDTQKFMSEFADDDFS